MEFRIDELAVKAGITSRTIRDYQARGLLPAPRLEGRTGWYSREHLDRLQVIADLQERGFSLAAIKATLDAWASGQDLQGLLDFKHVLEAPWGDADHQARSMPISELLTRFAFLDDLPGSVQMAIDSGLLEPHGDEFLAPAPVILDAAEYLLKLGMGLEELLELLAETQEDLARIAKRYVERVSPTVIDILHEDGPTAAVESVRKLRPFALGSVRAVIDTELRKAVGERFEQLGLEIEARQMMGSLPVVDGEGATTGGDRADTRAGED